MDRSDTPTLRGSEAADPPTARVAVPTVDEVAAPPPESAAPLERVLDAPSEPTPVSPIDPPEAVVVTPMLEPLAADAVAEATGDAGATVIPRQPEPVAIDMPPPDVADATPATLSRPPLYRRVLHRAAQAGAAVVAIWLVLILAYRFVNPPISTLMLVQAVSGTSIRQTWVPIKDISPNLVKAVIMSEDAFFCDHNGVDWTAMRAAWGSSRRAGPRGASTIPMQVAKNLFLWPGRSYFRKVLEVPLTYVLSIVWPKRRVMEIYLNVVEWGPGIFGAEAAAKHHFKTSARALTAQQAALLAAALPNPITRKAGRPNVRVRVHAGRLRGRIFDAEPYVGCVLG